MNCIAIWNSKTEKQSATPPLEVHFNLWKLGNKRNPSCFLDIGLMLEKASNVSCINIYIPNPIDMSAIEDLGISFKKNPDLASSLFNEDYRASPRIHEKIIDVLDIEGNPVFHICILDPENDLAIEDAYGGSIVSIYVPKELVNEKHYYRIRLKNPYVDSISHIYAPPNSVLESAFSQTELVDFRVNEKRNLDDSLLQRMRSEGEVSFSKTHLFLMREANEDYIYSHKPPNSSRQLELDLWEGYAAKHYLTERIIAYQWKETDKHDSFSAFVKFRFLRSNRQTIAKFIAVVIGLGTLSGLIANYLFSHLSLTTG